MSTASSEELQPEAPAIRMGSPFAEGTAVALVIPRRHESLGEGVWRETAAAASLAAVLLLAFLLACWFWFPGGGISIASLGIAMSLMGLISRHSTRSLITLLLHGGGLLACWLALLG